MSLLWRDQLSQYISCTSNSKAWSLTYDINSQVVLGALHIGIGETDANNFLTTMNIPSLNNVTFKNRRGEVGNAVECIASTSCIQNLQKEKENALSNNTIADSNGLIEFPVSYDMGWQKRGKGHNSLTGQGTAMGLKSGKSWHMQQDVSYVELVIMQVGRKNK